MMKSTLLFTAAAGLTYLSLTSYSTGPAAGNPSVGNRTGTGGVTANCSGSGCHGSIDPNLYIYFIMKEVGGSNVTNGQYKPGKQYEININPKYPTNPTSKMGFQLTAVKASNNTDVLGAIPPPPNTHITTVNNIKVLEHDIPLGGAGQASVTFTWTAPSAGTGKVAFHVIANAVNNNGIADVDDRASVGYWEYNEGPASVTELSKDIKITAYPNPSSDYFHLRFEEAETGSYTVNVIDFTGRKVYSQEVAIKTSRANMTIPVAAWASGAYFAQIVKDGAQRMIAISRQ
jgi:uncharacterized protein (DUF2147 family)